MILNGLVAHFHHWPSRTVCTLHHGACPPLWDRQAFPRCSAVGVVEGVAKCSPRDQFAKATGRKLALARALRTLGVQRDVRRGVWQAYFDKVGRP